MDLQHIFGIICNRMTHKKEEKFLIGGKIMLIGSHVGMKGKDMFLGSVKEALSYGANTFMVYTGAPQNTRRKKIEELRIEDGTKLMKEHGMETFVVHAPYIINLANTTKPETFELAVEFLEVEVERTKAMGSHTLVLHPGSHVGAGVDKGIDRIIEGLNQSCIRICRFISHWRQWQEKEARSGVSLKN